MSNKSSDGDLYQKAVSHMEYRKRLEESNPTHCTFQPNTGKKKSTTEKSQQDIKVTERLYKEASDRKAKLIDKSLIRPAECTFKPSISKSQAWHAPNREGTKPRCNTPTRLYNSTRKKIEKRDALVRKGEEDMLAKCSFQPTVPKRPASAPRIRSSNCEPTERTKEDITLKLYKDASEREKRLSIETDKIQKEIKIQSNVAVAISKINSPTSPTITANNANTKSKVTDYDIKTSSAVKQMYPVTGTFEERMTAASDRVNEKIKQKKDLALEKEARECTFKPARSSSAPRVRPTSSKAEANRPESPAHVRLMSRGDEAKKKIEATRQKKLEDEKAELTFKPKLVAKTPRHGQTYFDSKIPFYDRFAQKLLETEEKKKEARAREEEIQNRELTYTPVIMTKKSHRLSSSPGSPESKYSPAVFDRLASAQQDKRLKDEEKIKNELEKEMTFQPKIDQNSKKIDLRMRPEFENMPIHERLVKDGERRSSVMIEVKKMKEEEEIAPCTFKPDLSQSTESLLTSSAKMGRTPSPMRRGSYMQPTKTSHARTTPVATPDKATQTSTTAKVGASPDLRRSSFFQPTKASQARTESSTPAAARRSTVSQTKSPAMTSNRRANVSFTPKTSSLSTVSDSEAPMDIHVQILSTSEGSQIAERDRINDKEVIAARKPKQSSITMTLFDTIMAEQIDEFDAVVESRLQAEREKSVDDRQHTEREAEREAADEDARRQAKIETAEEEARPQAEREAAEETARLEAEREAAKGAARLQTEKEAAEEAARLEAEREAVEEAARQQADRDKDKEEEQDIIVNMNPTIACDGQC